LAAVYFGSSALVNLLVEEAGSELAAELWDGCDAAVSSRLACPEVRAALAAAGRNHDLDPAAARHALRGPGAVHLASALAVSQPGLILAAWDRRLRHGAEAAGLAVTPAAPGT